MRRASTKRGRPRPARPDPEIESEEQRRRTLEISVRDLTDVRLEAIEEAEAFDRTVRDRLAKRGHPEDQQLIAALKYASDIPVPTNAASHVATTLFRAALATALLELAAEYDGPITMATAVPAKYALDPRNIVNHDLGSFRGAMRKRLERCDFGTPVVAAVDYSLNSHASEAWPPHWQPHLDMWVFGKTPEEVTEALKLRFRRRPPIVPRPVFSKPVTDHRKQATYVLKARYGRRVTLDEPGTCPEKRPLGRYDNPLIPLLRALAKHDVRQRLILVGCRLNGGRLVPK